MGQHIILDVKEKTDDEGHTIVVHLRLGKAMQKHRIAVDGK